MPGPYEEIIQQIKATVLTDTKAVHVDTYIDHNPDLTSFANVTSDESQDSAFTPNENQTGRPLAGCEQQVPDLQLTRADWLRQQELEANCNTSNGDDLHSDDDINSQ